MRLRHRGKRSPCYARVLLALAPVALLSPTLAAQVSHQTVALSGDPAPGAGAGTTYSTFGRSSLSKTGQLAFTASIAGTAVSTTNDSVLYAGTRTHLQLVAREGDRVPGTSADLAYASFGSYSDNPPTMSGAGQVAYVAYLSGSGVTTATDYALFAGDVIAPQLVAREQDRASGTPEGTNYWFLDTIKISPDGRAGYFAEVTPDGGITRDDAIYAGPTRSPQLIARTGDHALATSGSVNYHRFHTVDFNDVGQVASVIEFRGNDVTPANANAVYAGDVTSPLLIARSGDAAPGTAAGVTYKSFYNVEINDAGQVLYGAYVSGTGPLAGASFAALYAGSRTAPKLVVREGDKAPGAAAGQYFDTYLSLGGPILSDSGDVAFRFKLAGSGVTNSNNIGLWAGKPGALRLVARSGSHPEGTDAGVGYSALGRPTLNDLGQVAFTATLTGAGVTAANDVGLFAFDPLTGNSLVAREGQLFDVGDGDLRTILEISTYKTWYDDAPAGLSNQGQIAFALTFTDGTSGLFVATIPEPVGPSALLGACAVRMAVRQRRPGRRCPD